MAVTLTLQDKGVNAPPTTATSTLAWIGVCTGGTAAANDVNEFTSDGLVATTLGYGPLTEAVAAAVRVSQVRQVGVKVNASTAATTSSVTQTGSGPLPTVSGTPRDSFNVKLKVVTGGALGTGQFKWALDGATYQGTVDLPTQTSAQVVGTVDLTAAGALTGIDTKTFIVTLTAGGPYTTTFSGVTSASDVVTQIQTAIGVAGTVSLSQGKYLKVVDASTGTSSVLTVGAGTANSQLGISAGAAPNGLPATYDIPNTGLTVTFPTGTYVLNEVYSFTTVEARFSTTDLSNAMTALYNKGVDFRDVVVLASPYDGADTRALAAQLATSLSTWRAAATKRFAVGLVNSSLGSSAAVATNDNDVKTAMTGFADDYVAVSHGDVYMRGTEWTGQVMRRPLAFALGVRMAAYRLSADPGDRENPSLDEAQMVAADLTTLARNEDTATTKMQLQGFTVARSESNLAYIVQGLTRSTSPKFKYLGIMRMAVEAARILYTNGRRYENASRFANTDGTLREEAAVAIEQFVGNALRAGLEEDASSATANVDRTEVVTTTNNLTITAEVQHLAYFFTVTLKAGVVSIL